MSFSHILQRRTRGVSCALLIILCITSLAATKPLVLDPVLVYSAYPVGNSSEVSVPTTRDTLGAADHQFSTIESPTLIKTATVVTWNGSEDNRWSNPGNWEGGRVPGTSDTARFAASSGSEVLVDADSSGNVAGLILEPDYHGTLRLNRDLTVSNDLMLAGGTLNQGNYRLSVSHYRQTGGK